MRQTLALAAVLGFATTLPAQQAKNPFEQKLTGDQAILHALDRLTFGPRPGDIEAVKKMGLKQWIDLQLHPERIPADEALETLADSFVEPSTPANILVLSKVLAQAQAELQAARPARPLEPQELIPMEQVTMLRQGTAQQDLDFLLTLPQEKEVQVLAAMPAVRVRVLAMLDPALRAKVEAALSAQHLTQPPTQQPIKVTFAGLLSPAGITQEQAMLLRTGTDKEALDFLGTLGPDRTVQVLAAMPVVKDRLLPLLDPDLRKRVVAASPSPAKPGQTLAQGKVYRALESDRQLEEVLADFWYNHFNVDAGKGNERLLVTDYDREAIRPYVLGKFRDLLEATANSPAMMLYLDNAQSRASGLNENYARELMELHTLGVNGGYTQHDIIEVARCFTGWTTVNTNVGARFVRGAGEPQGFHYDDSLHDKDEKTVLGVNIPAGGGKEDGEKVLDILAKHPSTARFISRELAQRFVADDPPQALVERMAKTFRDTDGDIRAVLATLFDSPEFFSEGAYRAKLKTPFEMIVSAVRATGAKVGDAGPLVSQISSLGQPLYQKLEPTGYSNVGTDWVNSASLLARMNFALDLAQNKIDGVQVDSAKFSAVPTETARQVLFTEPAPQTLDAIVTALAAAGDEQDSTSHGALAAGMLLGSPDFQRR